MEVNKLLVNSAQKGQFVTIGLREKVEEVLKSDKKIPNPKI